jgi:hypothetical protein
MGMPMLPSPMTAMGAGGRMGGFAVMAGLVDAFVLSVPFRPQARSDMMAFREPFVVQHIASECSEGAGKHPAKLQGGG